MVLAAVFLFYSLMIVWGPIMIDDWVFLSRFEQAGGNMFSLAAINGAVDNLRISNLVEPYVLVSSPWKEIFPWVNGLSRSAFRAWRALFWSVCRGGTLPLSPSGNRPGEQSAPHRKGLMSRSALCRPRYSGYGTLRRPPADMWY